MYLKTVKSLFKTTVTYENKNWLLSLASLTQLYTVMSLFQIILFETIIVILGFFCYWHIVVLRAYSSHNKCTLHRVSTI